MLEKRLKEGGRQKRPLDRARVMRRPREYPTLPDATYIPALQEEQALCMA